MEVEFLKNVAGDGFLYKKGQRYNLPKIDALKWLKIQFAKAVEAKPIQKRTTRKKTTKKVQK